MIDAITEKTIRLFLESDKPITSKNIANQIGMSESSVKHNMKSIKRIISSSKAILHSSPGTGFWLEANDSQRKKLYEIIDIEHYKGNSFTYRKNYILKILLEENVEYPIQLFADDLYVARNIVIRDLDNIEKWLSFFNIKMIRVRNKGIMIEGSEFDIRQAIIYNNSSLMDNQAVNVDRMKGLDYRISAVFYNYYKKVYPNNDIYYFQDIVLMAEKKLDYQFEDVSFVQLIEYITVSFNQIKKGRPITENNVLNKCRLTSRELDVARKIILSVFTEFSSELDIEIRCLAAQFLLYGTYEEAQGSSYIKEAFCENEAYVFVEKLQNIIVNKKILINDNLISDMALIFKKKKMSKSYQITNSNYLKYDIKEQLPGLYGIVLANIPPLEKTLNVKFTEYDIAYLTMLIDNAIDESIDEVKVLLLSSFNINTTKYTKKKISRSVNNIHIDAINNIDNLDFSLFDDYDVVLSTVKIDYDGIIKISRRLDSYDLEIIRNEVDKCRKSKQEIVTIEHQLFRQELICSSYRAKRKEDVLAKGVEILEKHGYCTNKFYDVITEREKFVTTSLGNGVAIPHGYKKEILKSGVAVIKLDYPINWNEREQVELVFVLAIDFNDRHSIYEFFAKFYSLIDDSARLEAIKKAETNEELFYILQDYGKVTKVNG